MNSTQSGFYVNPIRIGNIANSNILSFDNTTNEIIGSSSILTDASGNIINLSVSGNLYVENMTTASTSSGLLLSGNFTASGNIYSTSGNLQCNSGSIFAKGWRCRSGIGSVGYGTNSFNTQWTGSALQCWIDSSNIGNFTICDYRVKENITETSPILDKLCSIPMFNFEFKDISIFRKDGTHLGCYAHVLKDTFPEYPTLVNYDKDALTEDGQIQPQSISNDLVLLLMKSIQELKAEVNTLKNRVQVLENVA